MPGFLPNPMDEVTTSARGMPTTTTTMFKTRCQVHHRLSSTENEINVDGLYSKNKPSTLIAFILESNHQHRYRSLKLIISTSLGEYLYVGWFLQKMDQMAHCHTHQAMNQCQQTCKPAKTHSRWSIDPLTKRGGPPTMTGGWPIPRGGRPTCHVDPPSSAASCMFLRSTPLILRRF